MGYSWYNICAVSNNNKLKWKKELEPQWETITFADGMYDYSAVNAVLRSKIGRVDPKDPNSQQLVRLYFDTTIYKTVTL